MEDLAYAESDFTDDELVHDWCDVLSTVGF